MKSFYILVLLFFSVFSSGQNTIQIVFEYNNPIRINSSMKIVFGYPENEKPVVIYCDIYDKKFQKEISKKEYSEVIDLVKRISSKDIISSERLYLDATNAKITISNLGSSVSYSIRGLNDENFPEELFDFVKAAKKILALAELSISDLR